MSYIKKWWNYSRIIFLQVAGMILVILNELLPFLMGFDFEAFFTREISMVIQLVIQIATIVLRFKTFSPVGATASDKEALASVINSPVVTGVVGVDYDVGDNKTPEADETAPLNPKAN